MAVPVPLKLAAAAAAAAVVVVAWCEGSGLQRCRSLKAKALRNER